jgi:branched-chain amino acid transport system ATP-binding protein
MNRVLSCRNIEHSFGGLQVLKGVNIDLMQGEILGLIGPNGAGKSTLFNLIAGLLPIQQGQIELIGKSIRGLRSFQVARLGIARTFQIPKPFVGLTVVENLQVGFTNPTSEESMHLLKQVGLDHRSNHFAESLTLLELKQLELARALALKPSVLLLDEVMAGLSANEVLQSIDLITRLRDESNISILWVEHVMSAILKASNRLAVLHQGRMIRIGTPQDVIQSEEVIEAYLGKSIHEHS